MAKKTLTQLEAEVNKLRKDLDGFMADARKRKLAQRVAALEKDVTKGKKAKDNPGRGNKK